MNGILRNGQNYRDLADAEFGDYLDALSRVDIFADPSELSKVFDEAKRREMDIRAQGPLSASYKHALIRYPDSQLRCELIRFQWYRMTEDDRTFLITKGNTPERQMIASDHVLDLDTNQFKALLAGPEVGVLLAAYENGFPPEVRELFETTGIVEVEQLGLAVARKLDFSNLIESAKDDVSLCRKLPLGRLNIERVNPAIARMVQGVVDRQAVGDSLDAPISK